MSRRISRRTALKALGVAGAGLALPLPGIDATEAAAAGRADPHPILPLTSTSGVYVPPRGRAFDKFSFDFPEPSVAFEGLSFGVLVFSRENVYGLDRERMTVTPASNGLRVEAAGLVWAGGQERAPGKVTLELRRAEGGVEWDLTAEASSPIKAVTTVVRGVPRGRISAGGGDLVDHGDDEVLLGYPFSGGDLGTAGGLSTPLVVVQPATGEPFSVSSLDDRVRTKRFYLQPGEAGYRVEAVWEAEGWLSQNRVRVPAWRAERVASVDEALRRHYSHLVRAYAIPDWETRPDVSPWLRKVALVTTLHGMHYTGYVFNDYPKMLATLRWMATQIPPERVLVFLSAWDGRYYWDYPIYRPCERLGGERELKRLIEEGHRLGFRFMPMFGANAANRRQPAFAGFADAASAKIDGDVMDLNWVDWDNDRHQDGWLAYMNLGVDSWRRWLSGRIAETIERFGVDAYFLDISGGWVDNPRADMHEGIRLLVAELRSRFPQVLACGEFHYDALLAFLPLYHAGGGGLGRPFVQRHARFFQHLSHPAPGRGSSGVHESGFGRFDEATLGLTDAAIPTLNVVDDTFERHRETMAAVLRKARERAGLSAG